MALLESHPHLLPMAELRRAGPASDLGSTVDMTLMAKVWVSYPKGVSVGELTLSLVCCGVT